MTNVSNFEDNLYEPLVHRLGKPELREGQDADVLKADWAEHFNSFDKDVLQKTAKEVNSQWRGRGWPPIDFVKKIAVQVRSDLNAGYVESLTDDQRRFMEMEKEEKRFLDVVPEGQRQNIIDMSWLIMYDDMEPDARESLDKSFIRENLVKLGKSCAVRNMLDKYGDKKLLDLCRNKFKEVGKK